MEIEYVEESRLQVWSIRVNDKFTGILVLKKDDPWAPLYEIHQWDGRGFTLFHTLSAFLKPERYSGLRTAVEAMMSDL